MPAPPPAQTRPADAFFGPWVVRATFVMAMLGWGLGFYGPAIFLHAVVHRTGWPLAGVSTAVTVHYLFGALVVTQLPALHRRFGVGPTATVGAACAGLGVLGWSLASAPWQLLVSALASGGGWVTMGAAAVNAAIAPWYVRTRPLALAKAYNGASIGGVVFSPLWVLLMAQWGFTLAAGVVGAVAVVVMALLSAKVFSHSPASLGQQPDGDAACAPVPASGAHSANAVPGRRLWRDARFVSLALGMAAGLFAQIGLLAHLFSLLVPSLGAQAAGWTMGFATACAIAGRMAVVRLMPPGANRRSVAALAYAVQGTGTLLLMVADAQQTGLILLGVALFGSGIGNAISLPPLIAQAEFAAGDVPRVVSGIVALSQASYAFAPALLGWLLSATATGSGLQLGADSRTFFGVVLGVQALALASLLAGRRAAAQPG